jgi:hypothetical protein
VERLSLDERRQRLIENACASCGGSDDGGGSAGDMPNAGDSTGIANDDSSLLKALASVRKKRKPKKMEEAARPRPTAKMLMKAAQLESEKTGKLSHDIAEMKDMQWQIRMDQLEIKGRLDKDPDNC